LSEDQWEQASLPIKFAGLGVNQTKVVAGAAYVVLTCDLVAALLRKKKYEPLVLLSCWPPTRKPQASGMT